MIGRFTIVDGMMLCGDCGRGMHLQVDQALRKVLICWKCQGTVTLTQYQDIERLKFVLQSHRQMAGRG